MKIFNISDKTTIDYLHVYMYMENTHVKWIEKTRYNRSDKILGSKIIETKVDKVLRNSVEGI